jgi:uncharacterized GH25 family protein
MTLFFGRTRHIAATTTGLILVVVGIASAHDLFVKPVRYFVEESSDVSVRVLNGTFSKSENSIDRARLADVSVVSPAGRATLDPAAWNAEGDTSSFTFRSGAAGTYAVGVSTKPSVIGLTAKEFNEYLRVDGVPDVLEARRGAKELGKAARERYSKHVKALIQVGAARSEHFSTALGYPAELVPLDNPYSLRVGNTVRVRALVDGKPVANQFVLFGGRTLNGGRIVQRALRTNPEGVARIPLRTSGTWYIKYIHMSRTFNDSVDYESKWASLTFQVR